MHPPSPPFSPKKFLLLAGDALVFGASLGAAILLRYRGLPELFVLELYLFAAPFLVAVWILGFIMFGLYDLRSTKNEPRFFERLARALVFNAVVTVFVFYLVPEFRLTPLTTMLAIFSVQAALAFAWRMGANAVIARIAKDRVLFFGMSAETMEAARHLRQNPQLGYEMAAAVGLEPEELPAADHPFPVLTLGKDGLASIVRDYGITIIVISQHIKTNALLIKILVETIPLGVTVTEFPRFYEFTVGKIPVSLIGEVWFLENLMGLRRPRYEFLKRGVDLALALGLGLLTHALLPGIALAIILSTPSDVLRYRKLRAHSGDGIIFFRQERVGKSGRGFSFVKFRSQVLGAERLGSEKGGGADPRAYPVGTFLRKTYLDELPQVWNVIKGEMSFVGPRPERPEFVGELGREIPFYRMRELVTPGITGWAQLNMENDASVSDAPEKLQYDLYYIKNRSTVLDAVILLRTALKLMQRSGR